MNRNFLLGIDAGTQSTRAAIFDCDGKKLGSAETEHNIKYFTDGRVEHSPEDLWNALKTSVTRVLEQTGIKGGEIAGIGVDGTCSTTILCDSQGAPLLDAIVWMDTRAKEEVKSIAKSGHKVLSYSGGEDAVEWIVPKALWVKKNIPQVYHKSSYIVESINWLNFMLTGRWTASRCSSTIAWNYASVDGGWDRGFFQEIGLEEILDKWPVTVQPMGAVCGCVSANAAAQLGLAEGIPVGQGGVDAHVAMLGMGVFDTGIMAMSLGSSSVHLVLTQAPIEIPGIWGPYPEAVYDHKWLLQGGQSSTGSVVKWFKDNFCGNVPGTEPMNYEMLDLRGGDVPPGCQGLVALENFQGNRSPYRNPAATGIFRGVTLAHGKYHLYRALLEGAAFGTRLITDLFRENEVEIEEIRICGGGAKSRLWTQIHADVTGIPLVTMEEKESAVLGAAICGAVAAGIYGNLEEAAGKMTREAECIQPNWENHQMYEQNFKLYVETYKKLYGE